MKLCLLTATLIAMACSANADTFHAERPSNTIDAKTAATSSKPVFKCQRIEMGPNVNPVTSKGSKVTWHSSVGTGIDKVGTRLASGEETYKCQQMVFNDSNGRMQKSGN